MDNRTIKFSVEDANKAERYDACIIASTNMVQAVAYPVNDISSGDVVIQIEGLFSMGVKRYAIFKDEFVECYGGVVIADKGGYLFIIHEEILNEV